MSKITFIFAALLIILGLAGFLGTGSQHMTALIPTWIGLVLGLGGWLSISPSEGRRKLFAHINITLALVALIGAGFEIFRSVANSRATGVGVNPIALGSKITLAALLFLYIVLCVQSFISVRRSRIAALHSGKV